MKHALTTMQHIRKLAFLALISLIPACSVGPDYKGPPHVAPHAEKATAFHRADSNLTTSQTPHSYWWQQLNDPVLNELIETGLQLNFGIKSSNGRIRTARGALKQSFASMWPGGGAGAWYGHTQIPTGEAQSILGGNNSNQPPTPTAPVPAKVLAESYAAGFDATWEIDPFGGNRRALESAKATSQEELANMEDTRVRIAAEIARDYIAVRNAQSQQRLAQGTIDTLTHMLKLLKYRYAKGASSQMDIENTHIQLARAYAQIEPLKAQEAQYTDAVAIMVNKEPGELDELLKGPAPIPTPPRQVPVGNPAILISHRPDIRAAERAIAAANADVGEAVAEYCPKINLIGGVGFSAANGRKFFSKDSYSYLGGPTLVWNILNSGRIAAEVGEAKGLRQVAIAQYQRTVLSALQDAESSLSKYGHQRANVLKMQEAQNASKRQLSLAQQRDKSGTGSDLQVLNTQLDSLELDQNETQALSEMTTDYVALQKSLGLGWATFK